MTSASLKISRPVEDRSLIDELNAAVAGGSEEQRQRILERVADLFAAGSRGYSSDQIALFDDVLQKLAADIEVKARVRLANKLARIDCAPPKLIRSLAFDDDIESKRMPMQPAALMPRRKRRQVVCRLKAEGFGESHEHGEGPE